MVPGNQKMIIKIFYFVLISAVIYFGIAMVLICFVKPKRPSQAGLSFNELFFEYINLPELSRFKARDGSNLYYRYYPSPSDKIIILIHGSGWHSRYFLPLAEYLSSEGLAQVVTPDLRGHGDNPKRRGDIAYIGQFEDDLADLIARIRGDNPNAMLIVGGHSSGGGLAIRFGGGRYCNQADAYVLLSPFLRYNAPTMRSGAGGWALPHTGRIAGLTMLNNIGIHVFDYLPAIEFTMPKKARDGTETLIYSHRLNTAFAPRNYKKDLAAMRQPLLVIAGTADDAFLTDQFEPVISKYKEVEVKLLPNVTHLGLVVGHEIRPVIKEWLEQLGKA
jgi:non-heme chloroperoxidase